MTASVSCLLAFALTGEDLPIRDIDGTSMDFLTAMDSAGWSADRIRDHATQCEQTETPWPHPLPPHSMDGIGAAQWYALLTQVRATLGLDVVHVPPSRRTALTADERRLMEDLPPHHGPVG